MAKNLTRALWLAAHFSTTVFGSDYYPQLQVGTTVYDEARVLSVNESSLSIRHARGIAQVPLAELNSDLQALYGYDAELDRERIARLAELERRQVAQSRQRLAQQAKPENASREREALGSAFTGFGGSPRFERELDLRESYHSLGITVRNQAGRPSCSVHAIVGALEYQLASQLGFPVNVSENYLIEATAKSLGRSLRPRPSGGGAGDGFVLDEGFALEHVFQAIRGYGLEVEPDSDPERHDTLARVLRDARFSPFLIPGGNSEAGLANIVHVLNARMPLVAGLRWPHRSALRYTNTLSTQKPEAGGGHAVTLVGYRCETGRIEDARFIFRNSWGARWGAGGYGFVTYEYLRENLMSCYVVELR